MHYEFVSHSANYGRRVLLGQLSAFGDCLYATTVARQIKHDFPDCHLVWAISSLCRPVIEHNPHIDAIWEVPMGGHRDMYAAWQAFEQEVRQLQTHNLFDEVFLTQIYPNNFQNFDGTVRLSIFRGYPHPITVPIAPVMRLSPTQVERVREFACRHHLPATPQVVLFEAAARSGQSFVNPDYALEVARRVVAARDDVALVISSNQALPSSHPRIIDGSSLTFCENAELTKYCTLLVGCSSGITWLSTSDWSAPLPMVQILSPETSVYASVVHDFEYWGLPTERILEITHSQPQYGADCILAALDNFAAARHQYHEQLPVNFSWYMHMVRQNALARGQVGKALQSIYHVVSRYGCHTQIMGFWQAALATLADP